MNTLVRIRIVRLLRIRVVLLWCLRFVTPFVMLVMILLLILRVSPMILCWGCVSIVRLRVVLGVILSLCPRVCLNRVLLRRRKLLMRCRCCTPILCVLMGVTCGNVCLVVRGGRVLRWCDWVGFLLVVIFTLIVVTFVCRLGVRVKRRVILLRGRICRVPRLVLGMVVLVFTLSVVM